MRSHLSFARVGQRVALLLALALVGGAGDIACNETRPSVTAWRARWRQVRGELPHSAEFAAAVLAECIEAGVGGAVVISGGFAEVGRGKEQEKLAGLAREAAFPFIGPNCLGVFSPSRVDTLFLPGERMVLPEKGNVALVSQSGGILVDQMIKFSQEGIGLSRAVSIGNKALVGEIDLLDYLAADRETEVVAFYVEGFSRGEGRRFVEAAARCPKPVIVLKSGKTPAGSRAVSSHTASLAGDYKVFSEVLAQHGVVEAKSEDELSSYCEVLGSYRVKIEGRVGIVTASGGHGALAVDACSARGLATPSFGEEFERLVRKKLSPAVRGIASTSNPIDLTGSAVDDDFDAAVECLGARPEIDCVLVLLLPYLPDVTSHLGARLGRSRGPGDAPLIAYVPHVEKYRMLIEGFELNRVPVAHSIDGAVRMVDALRKGPSC